jgi:hypothetical protein
MSEEIKEGIRKSRRIFSPLYPVLIEKGTMNILDGHQRKQVDPTWPEKEVEITNPKERILIPMHANYRRQVSKKETATQLINLADILLEEGVSRDDMVSRLHEITPFSERYIQQLLPNKYKFVEKAHKRYAELVRHPNFVTEHEMPSAPTPVEKPSSPPQVARCPNCGSEIQTIRCPRCLKEVPLKKLKRPPND